MVVPHEKWGYIHEEENFFPDYVPDETVPGESKPGTKKENFPAGELPLDTFVHGGAMICNFHDLPDDERPRVLAITDFIDAEGLTLQPDEALMMERDLQRERRLRSQARQERMLMEEEMDEDLVDDTLEDVDDDDLDTESGLTALPADAPPPPVEFDFNDGFDDGYNDGDGGGDLEGSSIF